MPRQHVMIRVDNPLMAVVVEASAGIFKIKKLILTDAYCIVYLPVLR